METKAKANEIMVFNNEEFGNIRTIEKDGKVLFCGSDIAKALGYARPADAITAHCKGVCVLPTPSAGGVQNTKFITEGDVYRLITQSHLPSAEKFESWVFDDVLPTIRKTGNYATANSEIGRYIAGLEKSIDLLQTQITQLAIKEVPNIYAQNIWKKNISSPMISNVADKLGVDSRTALDMIYDTMTSLNGFCPSSARNVYCEKYGVHEVTTLDIIADNPVYQQQFANVVNKLLDNVNKNTFMDDMDDFDRVVYPLAVKRNDNSCCRAKTLHLIYSNMKSKQGWKAMRTRYHQVTNKGVIVRNSKLFSEMKKTVKSLMEV